MNVVLNAIQAMPQGGEIHLIAEKPNVKTIQLLIRDQGIGIAPQEQLKIFDAFYTTKTDGSGLGLAIVKRLADENNWKIDFKSTPGIGTEFVILIPMMVPAIFVTMVVFGIIDAELIGSGALAFAGTFGTAVGYMIVFDALFIVVCWLLFGFAIKE